MDGELKAKAEILPEGGEKAVPVTQFQTFLPVFQGEGLISKLGEKNVAISVVSAEKGGVFWGLVVGMLPWVFLIGFWIFMVRRSQQIQGGAGGLFQFGASRAKLYAPKLKTVTFDDVAGMDNVKHELMETVEFLKNPEKV